MKAQALKTKNTELGTLQARRKALTEDVQKREAAVEALVSAQSEKVVNGGDTSVERKNIASEREAIDEAKNAIALIDSKVRYIELDVKRLQYEIHIEGLDELANRVRDSISERIAILSGFVDKHNEAKSLFAEFLKFASDHSIEQPENMDQFADVFKVHRYIDLQNDVEKLLANLIYAYPKFMEKLSTPTK